MERAYGVWTNGYLHTNVATFPDKRGKNILIIIFQLKLPGLLFTYKPYIAYSSTTVIVSESNETTYHSNLTLKRLFWEIMK